jgi:hypothetical protein
MPSPIHRAVFIHLIFSIVSIGAMAQVPKDMAGTSHNMQSEPKLVVTLPKGKVPGKVSYQEILSYDATRKAKTLTQSIKKVLQVSYDSTSSGMGNSWSKRLLAMVYVADGKLWYLCRYGSGTTLEKSPDDYQFRSYPITRLGDHNAQDDSWYEAICPSRYGFYVVSEENGAYSLGHTTMRDGVTVEYTQLEIPTGSDRMISSLTIKPLTEYMDEGEESWTDVTYALATGTTTGIDDSSSDWKEAPFQFLIRARSDRDTKAVFDIEELRPSDRLITDEFSGEWLLVRDTHYHFLPRRNDDSEVPMIKDVCHRFLHLGAPEHE